MRSNIIVLGVIAVFFYICSAGYTLWHMAAYDGRIEWTGSLGLALTGVMATLIGVYLVLVDQGHFSPWSWWPIGLAAAFALMFLSFTGAWFLAPISLCLLIVMMVGWVYEYYRGSFSR